MSDDLDSEGRTPPEIMIYEELPAQEKEDVRLRARKGNLSDDPLVRALSVEWAKRTTRTTSTLWFWMTALASIVAEFLVGNGTGLVTLQEPLQTRKTARRIRRIDRQISRRKFRKSK